MSVSANFCLLTDMSVVFFQKIAAVSVIIMENSKILEILASNNRFWSTGKIYAGIERDLLPACLGQVKIKDITRRSNTAL